MQHDSDCILINREDAGTATPRRKTYLLHCRQQLNILPAISADDHSLEVVRPSLSSSPLSASITPSPFHSRLKTDPLKLFQQIPPPNRQLRTVLIMIVCLFSVHFRQFLPRDAMHKRSLCCQPVIRCLYVCLSVTFVDHVKTNKRIFKSFSPSGSHTILVFPHQTG